MCACVQTCVLVCVRACEYARARVCVYACVHARLRAYYVTSHFPPLLSSTGHAAHRPNLCHQPPTREESLTWWCRAEHVDPALGSFVCHARTASCRVFCCCCGGGGGCSPSHPPRPLQGRCPAAHRSSEHSCRPQPQTRCTLRLGHSARGPRIVRRGHSTVSK